MTTDRYNEAFIDGMLKRAEEVGMLKEAFLPTVLRMLAPIAGNYGLTKGLERLATGKTIGSGLLKGRKIPKGVATTAASAMKHLRNPTSGKGMLMSAGLFTGGDMLTRPLYEPLAQHLESKSEEQQPTYNAQQYYGYNGQ